MLAPGPASENRTQSIIVGAIRNSDHPEPVEGPSRESGNLTLLPEPGHHLMPAPPLVIPAKAGTQRGRTRPFALSLPKGPPHD